LSKTFWLLSCVWPAASAAPHNARAAPRAKDLICRKCMTPLILDYDLRRLSGFKQREPVYSPEMHECADSGTF
jgi:hypothetical protein